MDQLWQYQLISSALVPDLLAALNELGADGWEAVGFTAGGGAVPMPGMGARTKPDLMVLVKRAVSTA